MRRAGLPAPEVNPIFEAFEVDFLWRSHRVNVEVDGWSFHSHPRALERDRVRDRRLQAAGVMVLRFSWRQIRDEAELVVAEIAAALAQRRVTA